MRLKGGQMKATYGEKVKVHYTGWYQDGRIFASTTGGKPLEITIGQRRVIRGFEESLVGMHTGERKIVKIPPEEAYGPWLPERVLDIQKEQFSPRRCPDVGDHLRVRRKDGRLLNLTVTDISDRIITFDANHPLAGKSLTFDIRLLEVV
jgi:peptidylprolyl isomerase